MPKRQGLLEKVAERIVRLPGHRVLRVGIDGVDGAGKTVLADELTSLIEASGRKTIRASVDSFHNPKSIRYRQGRNSPIGYFMDSYNYDRLKECLLDPLSPGGAGKYRTAAFDHTIDSPVSTPAQQAIPGSILVVDGIFLHRPELRTYWDFSVFMEVGFEVSMARCSQRGGGSPDSHAEENRRYVEGQEIYLKTCTPQRHATIIINNDDFGSPYIVQT